MIFRNVCFWQEIFKVYYFFNRHVEVAVRVPTYWQRFWRRRLMMQWQNFASLYYCTSSLSSQGSTINPCVCLCFWRFSCRFHLLHATPQCLSDSRYEAMVKEPHWFDVSWIEAGHHKHLGFCLVLHSANMNENVAMIEFRKITFVMM
jgi:hypothetical protein